MPGGVTWGQMAKRDRFIEEAIKAIREICKMQGYADVSKETLALLVQRYVATYKPPALPGKRKIRPKLVEVKND
jgi:hypothetical protein